MRAPVIPAMLLLAGSAFAQTPATPTPAPAAAVYGNVSSDRLEKILAGMDVAFKKTPGKKDGVYFYEFKRQDHSVRLHNYDGLDLWIDSNFDALPLKDVNAWNNQARFSRAVLLKDTSKPSVSLEMQIDCVGGVTDAIVRQFVTRFDGELQRFITFTKK